MAGAGYKAFADGDVLTAAQVQTFLQDQAVMRFADSSARTSGLGTAVAEGMVSYLQDTDSVEVYDGSAWVGVGAGIRQVVSTTITGPVSIAAAGFQNVTGLSASITPSSASNKVLVVCYLTLGASAALTALTGVDRGGSLITVGTAGAVANGAGVVRLGSADDIYTDTSVYLDSPATTSSVTYQAQARRSGSTLYINRDASQSGGAAGYGGVSTLTLMEVAA